MIALLLFWRTWRFEIELLVLVAFVGFLTFDIIWRLEGIGAEKCENANTDARVAELVRDATARTRDAELINREATTYAHTLAAPLGPAPVFAAPVFVCGSSTSATSSSARRVPTPATPGRVSDGAAALPGGDRRVNFDDDVRVQTLRNAGRQADAQVAELQAYVRDVCRPGAPE